MAKRRTATPEGGSAASDLDILHPDRSITLADREVTVREYGFIEGQRLLPIAEPLLAALAAAIGGKAVPTYRAVQAIIGAHIDLVVRLAARSILPPEAPLSAVDEEVKWIEALRPDDGTVLVLTWWAVNGPFYMRNVVQSLVVERALSGGETSMPV